LRRRPSSNFTQEGNKNQTPPRKATAEQHEAKQENPGQHHSCRTRAATPGLPAPWSPAVRRRRSLSSTTTSIARAPGHKTCGHRPGHADGEVGRSARGAGRLASATRFCGLCLLYLARRREAGCHARGNREAGASYRASELAAPPVFFFFFGWCGRGFERAWLILGSHYRPSMQFSERMSRDSSVGGTVWIIPQLEGRMTVHEENAFYKAFYSRNLLGEDNETERGKRELRWRPKTGAKNPFLRSHFD